MEEGFYLNNVKYTRCPGAEGAARMNRSRSVSGRRGFFGKLSTIKEDFDEPRDWIFADREFRINGHEEVKKNENLESADDDLISSSMMSQVNCCVPTNNVGAAAVGVNLIRKLNSDVGQTAELVTMFQTSSFDQGSSGVFHKLRICVVEVQNERKPEFKKLIESNGGKVVLDLIKNRVDILLTSNDKTRGTNYKNARLWGIACINQDWVEESVKTFKLLPLDKYRVFDDAENLPSRQFGFKCLNQAPIVGVKVLPGLNETKKIQSIAETKEKKSHRHAKKNKSIPKIVLEESRYEEFNLSTRL